MRNNMVTMRINVDTDRCTGHGVCESIAEDIFEVGDEGIVHLLIAEVSDSRRGEIDEAVAECPTQALSIEGRRD
jgi:ferredoxin